jgi:outer membrane protein OmpA-like peptidoglycan-associated protein
MKNFYHYLSKVMLIILLALIPFAIMAQGKPNEKKSRANAAPSHSYWSVGIFGGPMQFNGDLSRNLFFNIFPQSLGYNFGFVATKQFTRVIGLRARFAFGMVQSRVEGKYVWEYMGGSGKPQFISQSFKSHIFESELQVTVNWINWILGYKPERILSSYLIFGFGIDQSKGTKRDLNLNKNISYLGKKGDVLNVGNTNGMGGSDLQIKTGVGIGLDININKQFSIPVEVYWRWQKTDLLDMTLGGSQAVVNDMYSSLTVGLTYKFAYTVDKAIKDEVVIIPVVAPAFDAPFRFFVNAPENIPAERRVREIFPLRNYVFFNLGSTEIPDRYVLLTKDQVKAFKEDQLQSFPPKNLSGRSDRQMTVYYNVLNILGDRMVKNPSTTVRLTGASMEGPDDGRAMAESVKQYLVNVFGIDPSRLNTEGRVKPRIPSEQPGGTKELDLLREGDRRVSIWSTSPDLLMEFQTGPDAPLKPVEIYAVQTAPLDSYVTINVEGARTAFSSWSLEMKDETGTVQNFGPYTQEWVSIPGKSILGSRPEGTYKITMNGQRVSGQAAKRDTTVHLVLWTPPKDEEMMRFSVIYEFNDSKAITIYEKYLTDIVVPKIPIGGTVLIHGYTDIIGEEAYNQKLSWARANDVRTIIEKGLSKAGRRDVTFEIYGFGEDLNYSPFDNKFPEERFYNRTVIIDIISKK